MTRSSSRSARRSGPCSACSALGSDLRCRDSRPTGSGEVFTFRPGLRKRGVAGAVPTC
jgi:hypothetical protein